MRWSLNQISVTVYFISFLCPVFWNDDLLGFRIFILGLFGFGGIDGFIIWFANLTFFFSLFAIDSFPKFRLILSVVTIALAIGFMFVFPHLPDSRLVKEPAYYGPGYILWLSAFAVNLLSALRYFFRSEVSTR